MFNEENPFANVILPVEITTEEFARVTNYLTSIGLAPKSFKDVKETIRNYSHDYKNMKFNEQELGQMLLDFANDLRK